MIPAPAGDEARWTRVEDASGDGIATYKLHSWFDFVEFLEAGKPGAPISAHGNYVWRGQQLSTWQLSTSLDRAFGQRGWISGQKSEELERRSRIHLDRFRYAARGRRGASPSSLKENEWWAVGQHYGLATPLLDWTRSPFAAAYFAFEQPSTAAATEHRAVFALDQRAVVARSSELTNGPVLESGRPPVLDFFDPLIDENARLVSQGGLFTRAPIGLSIEDWVAKAFEDSNTSVLLKVLIPDGDRAVCLQSLDRMNINHLSLFPDLSGASRFANLRLELSPNED